MTPTEERKDKAIINDANDLELDLVIHLAQFLLVSCHDP